MTVSRPPVQLHRLDKLVQYTCQLRGGILSPHQLFALLLSMEALRQDIVRAGDYLQWLAEVMTGHRQQRRGEVAVSKVYILVHGNTDSWWCPSGPERGWIEALTSALFRIGT